MPIERYSDEETERLLALAHANIPKRDGKRGTRNLKRQKRRWFLVRKIHKKQKRWRKAAHERRMELRAKRREETKEIEDIAAEVRARDRAYQREVLRTWAANMNRYRDGYGGGGKREVIQAEAEVIEDKV